MADPQDVVWSEEFDGEPGSRPNPAVWTAQLGAGGWGCDQRQTYTGDSGSAHITADGQLAITADRRADGAITSARLITKDKVTVHAGRVKARIKVPAGRGTWPAFWLLGTDIDEVGWPARGEIDIMEHVGSDPLAVHGTAHAPGYSGLAGGIGQRFSAAVDLADGFHRYRVDWTADSITWLLDGEPYHSLTPAQVPGGRWPFDQPFYLLVNLAIGGAWPGNDTTAPELPVTMLIDWIRVRGGSVTRRGG